jgi:hypothetical protein
MVVGVAGSVFGVGGFVFGRLTAPAGITTAVSFVASTAGPRMPPTLPVANPAPAPRPARAAPHSDRGFPVPRSTTTSSPSTETG